MKHYNPLDYQTKGRILHIAYATALALVLTVALLQSARADDIKSPIVPANLQVPAGNKLFLVGHTTGTQNYIYLPAEGGVKFTLFTPQATLFNEHKQVITHYFSPNPVEGGMIRATWQHSKDTSTVWGKVADGNSSADLAFVAPGAIPWLLVTAVGAQAGAQDSDTLVATTFIQRLNTSGGVAPATGCTALNDMGNKAFVPYTADYFFYKKAN